MARAARAVRRGYRAYASGGTSLLRDLTVLKWAGAIAIAFMCMWAVLVVLIAAGIGGVGGAFQQEALACETVEPDTGRVVNTNDLIELSETAAQRYGLESMGPAVLAAINNVETAFGSNVAVSTAGAVGWMQFMPDTWEAYGVDANGDGKRDPYDPADAIFAAANYLAASGAPQDWRGAIFAYNHATWYVDDVWGLAQRYAGAGRVTTDSGRLIGEFGVGAAGDGNAVPAAYRDETSTAGSEWTWPTTSREITSGYGDRWGRTHHGVDIAVPEGEEIYAALAGEVVHAGWTGGYGNYSCIWHESPALTTCYAHQSRLGVTDGQIVEQGAVIGSAGNTGHSFGSHLHFEVRRGEGANAPSTDPMQFLGGAEDAEGGTVLAAGAVPGGCGVTVSSDAPVSGGARGVVERAVEIARPLGTYVVTAHRPGDTLESGEPSDHAFNDEDQAARDIAVEGIDAIAGPPSPRLDRAAVAIGEYFGREYALGTTVESPGHDDADTFNWRGYRIQIIWRTPKYGGHMGHIHIGAMRLDDPSAVTA